MLKSRVNPGGKKLPNNPTHSIIMNTQNDTFDWDLWDVRPC